jgi:hypothetical protein
MSSFDDQRRDGGPRSKRPACVYHRVAILMLFQQVTRRMGYYVRHGCVGREMRRFVTSVISLYRPLPDHRPLADKRPGGHQSKSFASVQ